jgi:hypothetical protein
MKHWNMYDTPTILSRYGSTMEICINQEDITEKTHQIRLMNQIYRSAEQVIVRLGLAEDESDQVVKLLREVGQAARDWGLESYFTRENWHLLGPMSRNENPEDETTRELQKPDAHSGCKSIDSNWTAGSAIIDPAELKKQ